MRKIKSKQDNTSTNTSYLQKRSYESDSQSCWVLWWGVVSHFHITQPAMCQRATQTDRSQIVTNLWIHLPSSVQFLFFCLPNGSCITCGANMAAMWTLYFIKITHFVARSEICPCTLADMISELNGNKSQSERLLVLTGPVLVRANGKDDLSALFILGRQQEEC